ncbi:hypothetical protein [Labrys wisconsinensis]|uniref:Uncharacterized protein n=1 Tax=Labrys wisconsinensis TaxID=425677 RepID=A0ABU0JLN8_9HYPH|nr:hypothetical protein [Labrys wisconsinensis]MDQ0475203.1 hypothetical protein [Labrys wisconsinensis]
MPGLQSAAALIRRGAGVCGLIPAFALVAALAVAAPAETRGEPKIWFSMGAISSEAGHQSWETLYDQPSPQWPPALTRITVMGILTQALVKIPDADLAKVVAELKRRHIALGVEMLAQAYTLPGMSAPAGCGGGVEGYFPPEQTAALAAKVARAGGRIDYVAMDEPLWFGHYYAGPHACRSSVEDVAARVAANLREYQKLFPAVVIGDTEPFPSITDQPQWRADYQRWRQAFGRAVGQPLASLTVDINWGQPSWPRSLAAVAGFARGAGLPLGLIANAAPPTAATTNQAWLDAAVRNAAHIERDLGVEPAWITFTSWDRYPGHALTDRYGPGEDYVLEHYLERRDAGR